MKIKIIILVAFLLIPNVSFSGPQAWKFETQISEMTDELSCLMFSDSEYFVSTPGAIPIASYIYIGLQDSGNLSLISKDYPFNTRLINQIGVRVDKNPPFFGPQETRDGKILNFDSTQSQLIIEQMLKGETLTVQVAIFPDSKLITKQYPIASSNPYSYFIQSLGAWKGCQYNKQNKGWLGLLVFETPCDEKCAKEMKKDYGFDMDKITIVWGSDPRKISYKSGLRYGDIIISYNGKKATMKELLSHIDSMQSGDTIKLIILRRDDEMNISVTKP